MGNRYGKIATAPTPQTQPIEGRESEMAKNNAGGYSFILDKWKQLERFLILGSEGNTYYCSEKEMTKKNIDCLSKCIAEDANRVMLMIVDVSVNNKAMKNDPAEFALAQLAHDKDSRKLAFKAMPQVIRTGRTLLEFNMLLNDLGLKWNRSRRTAFANWYMSRRPSDVAYQTLKYPSASGWTHKDILRLCHGTKTEDVAMSAMLSYLVDKPYDETYLPQLVRTWETLKKAENVRDVIAAVKNENLTWEFVPGQYQGNSDVWAALLPNLPYTALIRNLGRLTSYKLLTGINDNVKFVRDKLASRDGLRKARVHPMTLLIAWKTYMANGENRAFKRKDAITWEYNPKIADALEDAFHMAFDTIEPSGKDMMLGIDVSGSMTSMMSNLPISCAEAATVLAMVSLKTEKNSIAYGFDTGIRDMGVSKNDNFQSALKKLSNVNGGGTDCAMPVKHALDNGMNFDQFVILTDNETWYGNTHPTTALNKYREKTGINSKMVVVAMTSTGFSIADPKDAGMIDVVGFDTSVPALISKFAQGM